MDIKKIVSSPLSTRIFLGLLSVVLLLVVFETGVRVGMHKARYSERWGGSYERMFGGRDSFRLRGGSGVSRMSAFSDTMGVAGLVKSVKLPNLVVLGSDQVEKGVLVSTSTVIRSGKSDMLPGNLTVDDRVVVFGKPNSEGLIEARLIRVMPTSTPNIGSGRGWMVR